MTSDAPHDDVSHDAARPVLRPSPRSTDDVGTTATGTGTAGSGTAGSGTAGSGTVSTRAPRTGAVSTGAADSLTDVAGLRVGHAQRIGDGGLTGTTVVLTPPGGAVAAVDVRGGGPGTRETDALDPRNLVQRIDAVVLTGGSAYGLDAASGVMAWLEEQGRGFPVGPDPRQVVPVVPAACVFDLGRGGDWRARPDAALGREAVERAASGTRDGEGDGGGGGDTPGGARKRGGGEAHTGQAHTGQAHADQGRFDHAGQGNVGAGAGAVAGGMKGGVGTASIRLGSGVTVGALVVVNAVGEVCDPATGALYGSYFSAADSPTGRPVFPDERVHEHAQERLAAARAETAARSGDTTGDAQERAAGSPPLNTTLAVVATDAELSRAQAQKLAGTAHDGLARAIRPVHLLHDGDTVFTLATGKRDIAPETVNEILAAGADAVTRAIVKAILAASTVDGPGGVFPSYSDLYGPH